MKKGSYLVLVIWGFVVILTAGIAFYFWKSQAAPHQAPATEAVKDRANPQPTTVENTSEKREPASAPSPQEQYRRALVEEDEMKRSPTWEEMRKEAPAEF